MANIAKHGVDLGSAADFDFETAKTSPDTRRNYGEDRALLLASSLTGCTFWCSPCAVRR
jgi:uncharacterized DUF497 family protein